jgi:hypothetical protein
VHELAARNHGRDRVVPEAVRDLLDRSVEDHDVRPLSDLE